MIWMVTMMQLMMATPAQEVERLGYELMPAEAVEALEETMVDPSGVTIPVMPYSEFDPVVGMAQPIPMTRQKLERAFGPPFAWVDGDSWVFREIGTKGKRGIVVKLSREHVYFREWRAKGPHRQWKEDEAVASFGGLAAVLASL
jgi:hypothetical protein